MSDSHSTLSSPVRTEAFARAWQTAVLALLGAFIVLAVGFASMPQVHEPADDTRHTMNFPCH